MNRTALTLALAAALGAGAVQAQTPTTASVAQPSSAAPKVVSAQSAAVVQTPSVASAPGSVANGITQTVYTPKLPTAEELTNAAAAQGYTVDRIVTTATQVIAFYRNANGQATTVAYQTLPPSGATAAAPTQAAAPAPAVVVTSPPPATVIYEERAPRVIYYDSYPRYYPYAWYPPVSLSFGFGYRSFHGGYHGGYRGGYRHR